MVPGTRFPVERGSSCEEFENLNPLRCALDIITVLHAMLLSNVASIECEHL